MSIEILKAQAYDIIRDIEFAQGAMGKRLAELRSALAKTNQEIASLEQQEAPDAKERQDVQEE